MNLNREPHYKRDSSSHFCHSHHFNITVSVDGGHAEQVGSKHCGIGISRNKAKGFLKKQFKLLKEYFGQNIS